MKNIGAKHENDPFYRYKRAVAQVKHLAFNGTTTRLTNCRTICSQLKVEPNFLLSQLQKKLGVPKIVYEKKQGVASIQGRMTVQMIEGALDSFIEQFIICPRCHLPMNDTAISKASSAATSTKRCAACGECVEKKQKSDNHEDNKLEDPIETNLETSISVEMKKLYDIPGREAERLRNECWKCSNEETWKPLKEKIDKFLSRS